MIRAVNLDIIQYSHFDYMYWHFISQENRQFWENFYFIKVGVIQKYFYRAHFFRFRPQQQKFHFTAILYIYTIINVIGRKTTTLYCVFDTCSSSRNNRSLFGSLFFTTAELLHVCVVNSYQFFIKLERQATAM